MCRGDSLVLYDDHDEPCDFADDVEELVLGVGQLPLAFSVVDKSMGDCFQDTKEEDSARRIVDTSAVDERMSAKHPSPVTLATLA